MNANEERSTVEPSTEQFVRKWVPQALTPRDRSECLMDLERLVLRRMLESDGHSRDAIEQCEQFDWRDNGTVAVKRVYALAVYKSAEGDIVIRQQRSEGEEDTVVVIPLGFATCVMDAIQRQLRDPALSPMLSRRPER